MLVLVQAAINAELFKEQLKAREAGQHRPHSWDSCWMVPPPFHSPHSLPLPLSLSPAESGGNHPTPTYTPTLQSAPGFLSLFRLTIDSEKHLVVSVGFKQKRPAAFGIFQGFFF